MPGTALPIEPIRTGRHFGEAQDRTYQTQTTQTL